MNLQQVMQLGFDWDTNEMSVMFLAKLAKPLIGAARIVINSIHIKGDVCAHFVPFLCYFYFFINYLIVTFVCVFLPVMHVFYLNFMDFSISFDFYFVDCLGDISWFSVEMFIKKWMLIEKIERNIIFVINLEH